MDTLASGTGTLAEWMAPLVMVIGVVVLGVLLTLSIRTRIARGQAEVPDPRERIEQIKASHQHRSGIDASTSEYLDTTKRLAAQLDFKTEKLEQLLREADAKIDELGRLLSARERSGRSAASRLPPRTEPGASSRAAAEPPASDEEDALTGAVYRLADAGHEPLQIARELNEQVGKVQLILALRDGP